MGVDYVVLPYAPGADTRLYFLPSLNLKPDSRWHIFEYAGTTFSTKRYFEELEEFIQLHCNEDTLVIVAHSSACRLSLEFLNKSLCYPDALAWISPVIEPCTIRGYLYQDIPENASHEDKLERWCQKLLNEESTKVAHDLIVKGEFNTELFAEFEDYLWKLSSANIPAAVSRLPIFALSGGLDPLNSFESLSIQLKDFYNKTLTELTDIGHCPFIESPNVLSFLLDDFVESVVKEKANLAATSDAFAKTPRPDFD